MYVVRYLYVCCVVGFVYAQRTIFFRRVGGKVTIEETKSEDGNVTLEL